MKQTLLQEKDPIFITEIGKRETTCHTMDAVVDYLKEKIASHQNVQFIGVFDHYSHTKNIGGEIAPGIQAAVDVIFCFGFALPNPQALAVRPRSIGVADMGDKFVLSFLAAPMQAANESMEAWVKGLRT
ncbi:MAG: hypothetical protein Q8O37_16265 [Sulfuricellaceae bacterium]|nr:hypothetical protein [Sulfuricellaceae bacterium]